jgi:mRNA-degrading endonuclease RelE of RelBE toxin-antitoxin system
MLRVTSFVELMPFAACLVSEAPYELVLTPPAIRAVQSGLPESVAAAVVAFLTGALVENPQRVGKRLRGDLAGIHSARRGSYRVLYRINEAQREVVVLRIDHRRNVYRPG